MNLKAFIISKELDIGSTENIGLRTQLVCVMVKVSIFDCGSGYARFYT